MREYVKPRMESESFIANEYVAACWRIFCNVPTGFGFIDQNHNGEYDSWRDIKLTANGVYGCNSWHTGVSGVPDDGPKANAMWQPQKEGRYGNYVNDGKAYDVYYWRDGWKPTDIHFSKVEDAEWETNPNAS